MPAISLTHAATDRDNWAEAAPPLDPFGFLTTLERVETTDLVATLADQARETVRRMLDNEPAAGTTLPASTMTARRPYTTRGDRPGRGLWRTHRLTWSVGTRRCYGWLSSCPNDPAPAATHRVLDAAEGQRLPIGALLCPRCARFASRRSRYTLELLPDATTCVFDHVRDNRTADERRLTHFLVTSAIARRPAGSAVCASCMTSIGRDTYLRRRYQVAPLPDPIVEEQRRVSTASRDAASASQQAQRQARPWTDLSPGWYAARDADSRMRYLHIDRAHRLYEVNPVGYNSDPPVETFITNLHRARSYMPMSWRGVLTAVAQQPRAAAARYGIGLHRCCMCNHQLRSPRARFDGYGVNCATRFHQLPRSGPSA